MPQPSFNYTVVTVEGDRNIKARDAHSEYATIESWAKENLPFTVAFKVGDKGVMVKEIYEGHDRKGNKIM